MISIKLCELSPRRYLIFQPLLWQFKAHILSFLLPIGKLTKQQKLDHSKMVHWQNFCFLFYYFLFWSIRDCQKVCAEDRLSWVETAIKILLQATILHLFSQISQISWLFLHHRPMSPDPPDQGGTSKSPPAFQQDGKPFLTCLPLAPSYATWPSLQNQLVSGDQITCDGQQ